MVAITSIAEWQLGQAHESAIAALIASAFDAFGGDFSGRSYYKTRHHLRLLAHEGDDLVGHLALTYRAMRLGERQIDVFGLAEVCCHPARRGSGIAGALVDRAIAEGMRSGAAFLTLFGSAGLYAGRGFRSVANPITCTAMHDGHSLQVHCLTAPHDFMVRPLGSALWDDTAPLDLVGPSF